MAFRAAIKPGSEAEYDRRHAELWPELRDAIRSCGFRNYTIFREGTSLFGYFEADDVDAALRRIAEEPVEVRWQEYMLDVLDRGEVGAGPPPALLEVFHLD